MTLDITPERLLAFRCLECLRVIRAYKIEQGISDIKEIVATIKNIEADAGTFDFDAAIQLNDYLATDCVLDGPHYYRECIDTVFRTLQPTWARAMTQGRERFAASLNEDIAAVFSAAGIEENPVQLDFVSWWDQLAGAMRLDKDGSKMAQARQAEILTLEGEAKKLRDIGVPEQPKWVGLDDNFAGYDVLSYVLEDNKTLPLMIEVKSTVQSPLRFILTRNEWETAIEVGERYVFHVWNMAKKPPNLHTLTVAEVAEHVPADGEKGKWLSVEIPLSIKAS